MFLEEYEVETNLQNSKFESTYKISC